MSTEGWIPIRQMLGAVSCSQNDDIVDEIIYSKLIYQFQFLAVDPWSSENMVEADWRLHEAYTRHILYARPDRGNLVAMFRFSEWVNIPCFRFESVLLRLNDFVDLQDAKVTIVLDASHMDYFQKLIRLPYMTTSEKEKAHATTNQLFCRAHIGTFEILREEVKNDGNLFVEIEEKE